ncbi:synaptotagmin-11 isoform X2 [Anopheles arabiensis]|uniref:synaptotagmin-11 isoform X2 n=1 Tax=Anopheles arabiensis TaxID=7173 RepID=UPI001AADA213|nr:synaptotagmin-11 isoform X2 [Anopheles arabiensis]
MGDHGPDMNTLETVVPAVLGLTAAAILAVTACFCARRFRRQHKKAGHEASSLPFQPPRPPKAVRSPSGQPPQYLKKSPSPTSIKPLPGHLPAQSPTDQTTAAGGTTAAATTTTLATTTTTTSIVPPTKYTEENELIPKNAQLEPKSPDVSELGDPSSCENGDGTEHGKLGTIVFKLRFLADRSALVVSVVRCRGLPGKNHGTAAAELSTIGGGTMLCNGSANGKQTATDPYVKLQLLPDKQHKVKTRVLRNTRNPVYDEDFTFYGLTLSELAGMSLHFVVLSFDRYSRDDVIGEVVCPLSGIDLQQIENQQVALSREIQPRSLKIRAQGRGELLISLCWQPAAARLTVVLLKARNLPRMDVTGLADPYVKIYLLYNGQRIAKKKTHVKKRTLSPVFNESFAFDIPTTEGAGGATLDGVSLELMLLDWDRVTKNEVIGRLELGGPRSNGSALNHWKEVCNSPRRQIADWHKLRE